jgi:hypothetical protein
VKKTITFTNKIVREHIFELSHLALQLWITLQWERRFPRRRVHMKTYVEKRRGGLYITDPELASMMKCSVGALMVAREELIERNLMEYIPVPVSMGVDKGIYRMKP